MCRERLVVDPRNSSSHSQAGAIPHISSKQRARIVNSKTRTRSAKGKSESVILYKYFCQELQTWKVIRKSYFSSFVYFSFISKFPTSIIWSKTSWCSTFSLSLWSLGWPRRCLDEDKSLPELLENGFLLDQLMVWYWDLGIIIGDTDSEQVEDHAPWWTPWPTMASFPEMVQILQEKMPSLPWRQLSTSTHPLPILCGSRLLLPIHSPTPHSSPCENSYTSLSKCVKQLPINSLHSDQLNVHNLLEHDASLRYRCLP